MKVWVLSFTELDRECYAEGAALKVTIHATREGALDELVSYMETAVTYDDYEASIPIVAEVTIDGSASFEYGNDYEYEVVLAEVEVQP